MHPSIVKVVANEDNVADTNVSPFARTRDRGDHLKVVGLKNMVRTNNFVTIFGQDIQALGATVLLFIIHLHAILYATPKI